MKQECEGNYNFENEFGKVLGGSRMDDKMREVIDQYELEIKNVYRFRGAYMLDTKDGLMILREFRGTKSKAELAQRVKEALVEKGYENVDVYLRNAKEELITESSLGNHYVLKKWFNGEECNLKDKKDVKAASKNLAVIHNLMRGILPEEAEFQGDTFPTVIRKHNRELRRVRAYIREKKQRNEFELLFLSLFPEFYREAEAVEEMLNDFDYEELYINMIKEQTVCHGSYNYHNILFTSQGVATTCFEKTQMQIQMMDFYDFVRKLMEKNNWNEGYLEIAMDGYESVRPFSEEEKKALYIALSYPEKFWKVTNFYYNRKKTWFSSKNIEKLQALQQQKNQRRNVLKSLECR